MATGCLCAPPSPPVSPPYSWGLSWLRAAWRNQRTQAWTLLVVCAPSRYQVTAPWGSTCVRPSHSVSLKPGGGHRGHSWTPPISSPGPPQAGVRRWHSRRRQSIATRPCQGHPGCPQPVTNALVAPGGGHTRPPQPVPTPHLGSWHRWGETRAPAAPMAVPTAPCWAAPPARPQDLLRDRHQNVVHTPPPAPFSTPSAPPLPCLTLVAPPLQPRPGELQCQRGVGALVAARQPQLQRLAPGLEGVQLRADVEGALRGQEDEPPPPNTARSPPCSLPTPSPSSLQAPGLGPAAPPAAARAAAR